MCPTPARPLIPSLLFTMAAADQSVEFKIYPQRNHAYLDNGCNDYLQVCFDRDAITPLQDILQFLDGIFWPMSSSPKK